MTPPAITWRGVRRRAHLHHHPEGLPRHAADFPDLTFRVTKLIGFRLRTFRNRVEGLLFKGTAAGLAQTLLDLGRDHGVRDDHGVVLPLRLSQTDLANLIGVTRESVNLTLTDFRKRGLVGLDGRTLRLLQSDALATIAHGV